MKKLVARISIISIQVRDASVEQLNSAFGIRFCDKRANYGLLEVETF